MKPTRGSLLALMLCATAAVGCRGTKPAPVSGLTTRSQHAAVVSVSRDASHVGRDVLMRGGNAVDAAVATAFALAVTFPEAGNIGGGGFMLIHPGNRRGWRHAEPPVLIDYRETAPAAATRDVYADPTTRPSSYA